jgi:hypothetical protein
MEEEAARQAQLISMRQLPKIVDEAVRAAHGRIGDAAGEGKIINRWEIYGRILRDLELGEKFANEVTQNVARQGFAVQPAILKIDRDILCGFIERANVPLDRTLG